MKRDREGTWDLISPADTVSVRVRNDLAGLRLDQFLARRFTWRSRNGWLSQIRDGRVIVDDQCAKASQHVRAGQLVVVECTVRNQTWEDPETIALDIIFEDDTCIVLNKEPGRIVHPVGKTLYGTYLSALAARFRNREGIFPTLVHRLDRDTSGVLLVAKNPRHAASYAIQFENRLTVKHYHAIVHGVPANKSGTIDGPIGPIGDVIRLKRGVISSGQPAITDYRVLRTGRIGDLGDFSLVECVPKTGRTHQIRVHLSHIGCPIAGDWLYGGESVTDRFMLHAVRLKLKSPSGFPMNLFAPHPEDFRNMLSRMVTGTSHSGH